MYGSKHHIGASGVAGSSGKLHSHMHHGDSQNHLQQVNGSNSNIPWRHRQCPSVGSSSSGTSIASKFRSEILLILTGKCEDIYYIFNLRMGSVEALASGDIYFADSRSGWGSCSACLTSCCW